MSTSLILSVVSPAGDAGSAAVSLGLVIGLVAVAALMFVVWLIRTRQRTVVERERFVRLQETMGFGPVADEDELRQIAERVGELFGEHAIYARQLHLAGALRRAGGDGLIVDAVQVRLGMDASNANINTLAKLVVMVHGQALSLPEFSLLPNHFLFSTVQKDPVFHHTGAFGRRNLVLGEDKWFIAHVLGGDVRDALAENRDLVIESRDGLLAFYLHDERVQARDLAGFVNRCLTLSRGMVAHAGAYKPAAAASHPRERYPLRQV